MLVNRNKIALGALFFIQSLAIDKPCFAIDLKLSGSTTLYQLNKALLESYKNQYPRSENFIIEQSSSGKGMRDLAAGTIDLARSSRPIKGQEIKDLESKGQVSRAFQIGSDALAIYVHKSLKSKLMHLNRQQILGVFVEGSIRNWSQLIPDMDAPIEVLVGDPRNSGTSQMFLSLLKSRRYTPNAQVADATGDQVKYVQKNPHAMTYASVAFNSPEIHSLGYLLDGRVIEPSNLTISNGHWPFTRRLYFVIRVPSHRSLLSFMDFVLSQMGQEIIAESGVIPISGLEL